MARRCPSSRNAAPCVCRTPRPATTQHLVTRETCYQGESASDELAYAYSGVTIVPTPYDVNVEAVRQKVQALFPDAPQFNTCLLNYYRSGARP